MKKSDLAPWPAPGSVRGPLDEDWLKAILPSIKFPPPTPETAAEAEREAEIFAALARAKPGRIRGKLLVRAGDPDLAHECLTKAHGNARTAMRNFIDRVKSTMSEKAAKSGSDETTAKNRWYAATEPHGRARRARRK